MIDWLLTKKLDGRPSFQQMIQTIVQSYCRPDGVSRFDTNATDLARIYTGDYPQLGYQVTGDRVSLYSIM